MVGTTTFPCAPRYDLKERSHDLSPRGQADGLVLATRGSLGSRDPDPFVRLMFSEEAFLPQPATPSFQRARNHPPGKTSSIQGCRSFSTRRRHAFIPPLKGVGFRRTFFSCKDNWLLVMNWWSRRHALLLTPP